MHCIVPFAAPAPASEAGRAALATMQWPALNRLLPELTVIARDEAEPTSFSPPHERVLARALGWRGADAAAGGADGSEGAGDARVDATGDGCWPFAARAARADGIDVGDAAWGLVSPAHWHVGTDQVSLVDPQTLQLDDAGSRQIFAALEPLFADEGIGFVYGHATRWYVADESLQGLATASLDRVAGRNVDAWLGGRATGAAAGAGRREAASEAGAQPLRRWRRLQAEAQMLLHNHPLNAEREARGLLPINSFWLSGCGRALPETPPPGEPAVEAVHVQTLLRAAALAEDWPAWMAAWGRFEAGPLQAWQQVWREPRGRGEPLRLTLAGERAAVTLAPAAGGALARLKRRWSGPTVAALLQDL